MQAQISMRKLELLYPGAMEYAARTLHARARQAGKQAEDISFSLEYTVSIGPRPRLGCSIEEQKDWIGQNVSWSLMAKMGRRQVVMFPGRELPDDAPLPDEVIQAELNRMARGHAVQADYAAMDPQERERRADEALFELRRGPGFVELKTRDDAPTDEPQQDGMTGLRR